MDANGVRSTGPLVPVVNFSFFARFAAGLTVEEIANEADRDPNLEGMHPQLFPRLHEWLQFWAEQGKYVPRDTIIIKMPTEQIEQDQANNKLDQYHELG